MSGEHDEPRWDLLPDRPFEFFELEPGFERADLKRAYNRWIRRFKPERHPDEFTRIRAAYEHLEELLRYGTVANEFARESQPSEPTASGRDSESTATDPEFDAAERLATLAPGAVLAHLRSLESKTSAQWLHEAILADELERDDALALYDTLIRGVEATRGAQELVNTLVEACREPIPAAAAGRLLQRLSGLVAAGERTHGFDPGWFWFASEPIWLSLLERVRFDGLRQLLERISAQLGEGSVGHAVLLMQLVRRGVQRADRDWIDSALDALTEDYARLPGTLQDDLDLFMWLEPHVTGLESNEDDPIGEQLVETARAILTLDEVEADRTFLATMAVVVDSPDEAVDAFPDGWQSGPAGAVPVLEWYADEVAARRGDERASNTSAARHVAGFLRGLEKATDRSLIGRLMNISFLLQIGFVIALACGPLWLPFSVPDDFLAIAWGGVVAWYGVLALVFWKLGFRWLFGVSRWLENYVYEQTWRPAVLEFLASTHLSWGQLMRSLEEFSEFHVSIDEDLSARLAEDPGVRLYAAALDFS